MIARHASMRGTPAALLERFNRERPQGAYAATGGPASPWALSKRLRRLSPQSREVGTTVLFNRHKDARIIRIATPEALGQEMPV
jgi:hypothetical protein